jgi:hypothetical protein
MGILIGVYSFMAICITIGCVDELSIGEILASFFVGIVWPFSIMIWLVKKFRRWATR